MATQIWMNMHGVSIGDVIDVDFFGGDDPPILKLRVVEIGKAGGALMELIEPQPGLTTVPGLVSGCGVPSPEFPGGFTVILPPRVAPCPARPMTIGARPACAAGENPPQAEGGGGEVAGKSTGRNIYVLKLHDNDRDYQCNFRLAVIADSEAAARMMAADASAQEGRDPWLGEASCRMVGTTNLPPEVLVIENPGG